MKKVLLFILTIILFITRVEAKSIDDLYNELETLKDQKELCTYLSDDDIKEIIETSMNIEVLVEALNEEINSINNEITTKENDIKNIQEEIDNLLVFNQVSQGENVYLEYIFNSESYSEMIYRYMVAEQMTSYNNSLIEKLNIEIEELNTKREELNKKQAKIERERASFRDFELVLKNNPSASLESISTSLDEDIASLKKEIAIYESKGCKRYDDLNICLGTYDNEYLTYPLMKGCVSKEYFVSSTSSHKGIDLACNKEGNDVYASGSGVVAEIITKSSCGGNIIFIYYKVMGKEYTAIYAHLLDIKVAVGDFVTSNTIIGTIGGESTSTLNGGYDRCTTGAHLHYVLTYGYHTNDYSIYTFNPRYMNSYPSVLNGYFVR